MVAASRAVAYLFLAIGIAILAETIWLGGGHPDSLRRAVRLAGAVFIVLGVIRLRALP